MGNGAHAFDGRACKPVHTGRRSTREGGNLCPFAGGIALAMTADEGECDGITEQMGTPPRVQGTSRRCDVPLPFSRPGEIRVRMS